MNKALIIILAFLLLTQTPRAAAPSQAETPRPTELPGPTDVQGSYGVALPNGLLPDSGYAAAGQPARYYDNTTLELIPAPGYGRIWPYIGGWAQSRMGTWSELIGICDDTGRIICDPVYNDVEIIERDGARLYVFIKNHMEPDTWRNEYINTLAPVDGSWTDSYESIKWKEESGYELSTATDEYGFMRGYLWRGPVDYDYITAQRDGKWGVLGWDGTVLLPFEYLEPVCFSEGLASVLSEDERTVSFIDISGRVILGPYEAPPKQVEDSDYYTGNPHTVTNKLMFIEGHARFYRNGKYGMMNRDGKAVIPAEYDYITSFSHGIAMTVEKDPEAYAGENYGLVNDSGAVLLRPWRRTIENVNGVAVIRNPDYSIRETIGYDGTSVRYNPPAEQPDVWLVLGDGWLKEEVVGTFRWPPLYRLIKPDGTRATTEEYYTVIRIGDRFAVRGERIAGLMDENGEYIIQVPMTAFTAD